MEIHMWWLALDVRAKEWLRENPESASLPPDVAMEVVAAGGELANGTLTAKEWDFIETQSQFID
ncbi:hypothetical protein [Arthrobacter sp. 35W]|uniref:hypothetical protein n=1 Tax=Arthrobacter sp. 35W TaxID=1132441 RepID=UPI00047B5805|nr:hypothetical protein [Arthrobacter sp. 35W]